VNYDCWIDVGVVDLLEACVAFLIIIGSVSAYKFSKKYEFKDVLSSLLYHCFGLKLQAQVLMLRVPAMFFCDS
jgi:hypothetical protein